MPTGSCIYLSLFDVCVLLFVEAIFYIFVRQCFVFHYGNTREQTAETSANAKISRGIVYHGKETYRFLV